MSIAVSVIIPVYNRLEMLRKAVESVLSQSFNDMELIVVDDGSLIDLTEIQERVQEQGHCFLRTEHRGVAAARNTALKMAQGEWIALLDSDDLWYPEKLERQLAFHERHPELKLSQTLERWYRNDSLVNKQRKHEQPEGEVFRDVCERCCVSSSSVILHHTVFNDCGIYDTQFPVCEDYEFWLRVASRYQIGLVPETLVEKYGGHEDQLSKAIPAMDRFRVLALLKMLIEENLQAEQVEIAREALRKKVEILKIGAQKKKLTTALLYELLEMHLESSSSRENLRQFYPQIQAVCQ
ncbi:MAG: glycosyltransferase [Bdellovibrionales bacterium]|nr:glycosyltransferase [Bdellovibrionales bacterium]